MGFYLFNAPLYQNEKLDLGLKAKWEKIDHLCAAFTVLYYAYRDVKGDMKQSGYCLQ